MLCQLCRRPSPEINFALKIILFENHKRTILMEKSSFFELTLLSTHNLQKLSFNFASIDFPNNKYIVNYILKHNLFSFSNIYIKSGKLRLKLSEIFRKKFFTFSSINWFRIITKERNFARINCELKFVIFYRF